MDRHRLWSLQSSLEGFRPDLSLWRAAIVGAGLGLTWGVLARLWMRLVSEQPQFSISGTAIVLGASACVGMCAGTALVLRSRGRLRQSRSLAAGAFVLLKFGPGMVMVITVLLATLALVQHAWKRWVRLGLGMLAIGGVGLIAADQFEHVPLLRWAAGLLCYLALLYPLIWTMRIGLTPRKSIAVS